MTTTDPKLIEPVAWLQELVAEGLWQRKRKALGVPAAYLPRSRTDFMDEAAAAINEAAQKERARIWARMCSIEPDEDAAGGYANWGDFLQILEGELAAASERGAAMDALIADSADMIEAHKESQHGDA